MKSATRYLLAGLVAVAAYWGFGLYQEHLIAQGDAQGAARVQKAWDDQERLRSQVTAAGNTLRQRNAEKVAHEQTQRETASKAAADSAATSLRSLRAELARFKARAKPYPDGDAGLAACAGEAATARELFGESAEAFVELAAEADQLRDQVAGLQQFASSVCRAGQPLQPATGAAD